MSVSFKTVSARPAVALRPARAQRYDSMETIVLVRRGRLEFVLLLDLCYDRAMSLVSGMYARLKLPNRLRIQS